MDEEIFTEILENETRAMVLWFLVATTRRSFSEIEIAKKLQLPSDVVRQQLTSLEQLDLVSRFTKKSHTWWYLTGSHQDLTTSLAASLSGSRLLLRDELIEEAKKMRGLEMLILSGVFTGADTPDVDMIFVGSVDRAKLAHYIGKVEQFLELEINYTLMELEEFTLRKLTSDKFTRDILEHKHLITYQKNLTTM